MNFYSSNIFCEALAASYFPNQTVEPALYRLGSNVWCVPTVNQTKPLTKYPLASTFIDFYEPCSFAKSENQSAQASPQTLTTQAQNRQVLSRLGTVKDSFTRARLLRSSQNKEVDSHTSFVEVAKGEDGGLKPIHPSALKYLPRASHGLITAKAWNSQLFKQRYEPAPTVLWNGFHTWTEFRDTRKTAFADINQRQRQLERDLGTVTFQFDDPDPETLIQCMAFKSQQYKSSGEFDIFARLENVRFFQELAKRKLITISSLRGGDQLLAATICVTALPSLHYWLPAYDAAFRKHSPGMLLLSFLLEESFKQGYEEFNFLTGNESYKWNFATHTRLISEVGQKPLHSRIMATIINTVSRASRQSE